MLDLIAACALLSCTVAERHAPECLRGVQVYSASSDGTVGVWDAKTCECLKRIKYAPVIASFYFEYAHPCCCVPLVSRVVSACHAAAPVLCKQLLLSVIALLGHPLQHVVWLQSNTGSTY